ncbi:MAG: nitroreductase family protein [Oscillospiraceae bacterium]|nr:nitroreductase family protein [Oscillospiraceae bacterium]
MNYSALIQNRKSFREFTDKQVFFGDLDKIREYYNTSVRRLLPEIKTELRFFGTDARAALEGAAGYNQFLVGAPQYMVLLSEKHPMAHLNAGYVMEDLILKLTDMELNTCWLTFADSNDIKKALSLESNLEVAAIAAFGYGKKTVKRLRLNIRSMSDVDIVAQHQYVEQKRSVYDMAFMEIWGNTYKLDDHIGFFDDMLWESLYAASLSPSYLNRQAYGFVIHPGGISLVNRPDAYNTKIDGDLSLGIVLHHFTSVAENWMGKLIWRFGKTTADLQLPEGHEVVATCAL